MKNDKTISIKKPCSENFNTFSKTELGGYCNSCEKEVIDFTTMTISEINNYFLVPRINTCGRFKNSQLQTIKRNTMTNYISKGLATMSFSLLALCSVSNAQETTSIDPPIKTEISSITMGDISSIHSASYTIKGTVLDEENIPLPGVNVVLKGTQIGTVTDLDGNFEFPSKLEINDVLLFSYIGYDTKEYKVKKSDSETISVTINFTNVDVELMGAIEVGGVYKTKKNIFQKFIGLFK
ncbi:carboxypeptidase-like regulatory domain-containing protein [uncultured Maribacter sp.]|uniref:carboxypeptidase-like regulatory domain-containing protein n=1 Tax=uncultured Maribacter sp. TaxID=431308 RepID=UPI00260FF284|nr:carboxypeptidase-like regulatory domain-containing protein [uncultured Maribacter sp.]